MNSEHFSGINNTLTKADVASQLFPHDVSNIMSEISNTFVEYELTLVETTQAKQAELVISTYAESRCCDDPSKMIKPRNENLRQPHGQHYGRCNKSHALPSLTEYWVEERWSTLLV
jgi:hypothetical protein